MRGACAQQLCRLSGMSGRGFVSQQGAKTRCRGVWRERGAKPPHHWGHIVAPAAGKTAKSLLYRLSYPKDFGETLHRANFLVGSALLTAEAAVKSMAITAAL